MVDQVRSIKRKDESQPRGPNLWSEYEIEAKSSLTDRTLRNLKYGDAFAVMDDHGDIGTLKETAEGLYYRDTRYLSKFELWLEGKRPLLLSSAVHEDKAALSVELTNPDVERGAEERLGRDTIFVQRTKFLYGPCSHERIGIKSFAPVRRRLLIDFLYEADFSDMFEVRGTRRLRHGQIKASVTDKGTVEFVYRGLDRVERRTVIEFSPAPLVVDEGRATIEVELAPYEHTSIFVTVSCLDSEVKPLVASSFLSAYRGIRKARRRATEDIATVRSSTVSLNDIVCRATADAYTLISYGEYGPYPYAGIPWFNTIFGRDGIITAILMLWTDPSIARGVLRTLAATQAKEVDPYSDAQPGKIIHEMRHGEMARLREVPFAHYYGTIDATPLFVVLAGMYLERTGDLKTIREIWPNIYAAIGWIDNYGDLDGDGFVEYARAEESGLANQGWKDSHDAIFHADGSDAVGPIALCEVQGYVFAARNHASRIAVRLGLLDLAETLSSQAERLRADFEQAFWCDELGTYALALDGEKRPCRVVASNAGQALFSGIASPERARSVAANLLTADAFSGWGIRTLAVGQPRYNPLSYHNGSVWPHDNALIAMGFSRYGLQADASRVFAGIFDAARHQDLSRLPELFCGFNRSPHRAPTPYPVACAPQAWAATSIFGLLGACLGLELVHDECEIRFRNPVLPEFVDELIIRNLRLKDSRVDIRVHRYGHDVTANVLSREGQAKIAILK
ncbi:amylo-alpha-1,6-glucosidase [Bradyrhizobium sp. LHD-71]|uniref:amylo-alpha-1,6-glucosidase n=1 Tax=Bradyrhizobium sp. LHD-71 TaxID=3072141 RepID=UPI00280F4B4C|nr:amylo-alpha-1,6-glucosidase [Bradyrhizobium sp. LHD-71]MDQ8729483.1 amylo-alpha-1,6-glucosidase [Bradyrhizobium sp. LHD-71]